MTVVFISFLFLTVSVKRIEKTKNRVKFDLEATIKAIDSKYVEILSVIESADSKRKKMELAVQHIGLKNREIPASLCKTKTLAGDLFFFIIGRMIC